jgi:hypothetical protein
MTLLRKKLSRITIAAAGTLALAGLAIGPSAGTGLAATQAHATVSGLTRPQAPDPGPPFVRCVSNPSRAFPCEAGTKNSPVFFYPHDGSASFDIGVGTEIFITCWYNGTPVDHQDMIQDHITEYSSTSMPDQVDSGHVPDYHVDLGGANPSAVGIPECAA